MILLSSRTSGVQSFFQLIGVLLIFVFVLAITYYVTKWIAGYQKQHNFQKNMRVVETMKLTTNKYIQIIEVGETYLVIGIGKDDGRETPVASAGDQEGLQAKADEDCG